MKWIRKTSGLHPCLFFLICIALSTPVSASSVLLSDQGTDVKQSGAILSSGDLTVLIYSASSGETPLFNQTFTGAIINGSWNVMINPDLEFGRSYWKDYAINGVNLNFSGQEKLEFTSPVGYINNASFVNFSLIQNCPSGQAIRQVYANGSVVCENIGVNATDTQWNITGSNYMMNASGVLGVNETRLNNTIDARVLLNTPSPSSAAGWTNDSIQTNTSLNINLLNGRNITTNGTGFFGFLGSLTSRISRLFVQDIEASGNVNVSGNVTASKFIGDGSLLTGISSGVSYTHLSNFTDDLGNRGYTSLSNFTNNVGFINSTQAQVFNDTAAIASKLDATDQRYNETIYINTNFYIKSQVYNTTEILAFGYVNSSSLQSYNETSLITSVNQTLSANKLDVADQRYNDTAKINAVNTTVNIDSLGFLNKSGTNANQNINFSPYNITAARFIGDGSLLTGISSGPGDGTGGWTNTSTTTSTALNVNVSGNVTASKFIGDGSLLTNLPSGTADGTGGWTNTSTTTSTSLNVNTTGNLDVSGVIKGVQAGNIIPFYYENQTFFPSATTYHGAVAHSHLDGALYYAHGGSWIKLLDSTLAYLNSTDGIYLFESNKKVSLNETKLNQTIDARIPASSGYQSSAAGWVNDSIQTNTSLNVNLLNGKDITTTGTGFFGFLGSLASRVTKLWVGEINATGNIATSGNVSADKFIGDGSLLTNLPSGSGDGTGGWTNTSTTTSTALNVNVSGNVTASKFIGDGSLLTGISSGVSYTHLSNFTDDLGNRGYTSLSNFTNNVGFINSTQAQIFNDTAAIASKLDATDQRYNETSLINNKLDATDQRYNETIYLNTNFYIKSQVYNTTEILAFGFVNSSGLQNYNETSLITSVNQTLSANKLDVADQRYNDTAKINAVNTTVNIDSLGFLNKSGTNANQNIDFNPYNITAAKFIGDGSLLINLPSGGVGDGTGGWTNTSTITSTSLNVNVTGNITANKFIGDGSLLTNLPPGGVGDGTGGWTNTSTVTSTTLNVNVTSGNLTIPNGRIGIGTAMPGSTLDVKGTLRLSGSASGFVGIAPAAAAGSVTYTLPSADGISGQVLSTNGGGTLLWTTASSGGGGWADDGTIVRLTTAGDSVVVGHNAILTTDTILPKFSVLGGNNMLSVYSFAGDSSTSGLTLGKSKDGTVGNAAYVLNSETLGVIRFAGADGYSGSTAKFSAGATIKALSTEGWSGTAHGTKLVFQTTANGATANSDGMTIEQNGNIGIGASNQAEKLYIAGNVKSTGNVTASKFIGDGSLLTGISGGGTGDGTGGWTNTSSTTSTSLNVNVSGNVTASKFIGDGSLLTGISSGVSHTHLSNFTDDLGNRGYTSLSNFTNNVGFINSTQAQVFNDTAAIASKLDATDQRYNETIYLNTNFYTKSQVYNRTEIDAFGFVNSSGLQNYNETSLITSVNQTLSANKLDVADQRYNDTAQINAVNTSTNIDSLGFLNKSGTNANQNINFSPYNITAAKFIGDGSLLTGITATSDGTGGWINTTTVASTSLNVNITTGNLTIMNGKVGIGTASPSQALQVVGQIDATNNISTPGLCLNGDCRNAWPGSGSSPGGSNGQIQFNNNGNFGADGDLTWDNTNKRLGIGTANPQDGFQINNRIPAVRFSSGYGSSSVSNVAYWGLQDDSNNNGATKGFVWRIDKPTSAGSSADLTLRLVQGFSSTCSGYPFCNLSSINGVGTDAVTFAGNGNVGIGATNPGGKLEINTGGGTGTSLKIEHSGSNFIVRPVSSGGSSTVIENTGGGSIVINPSGGNVGIGTASPAGKLDVSGTIKGEGQDLIIMRSFGWASGDFGNDLDTGISATTYSAVNLVSWDAANADDWTRFDVGADGDWHLMSYGGRAQITFYHKSIATRDLSG